MSSIFNFINNCWGNFVRRRKLSLHNTRNNAVIWHTHISPLNIILSLIAVIASIFVILLTVIGYTPLLENIPGFKSEGMRMRREIVDNISRLDSLEQVVNDMMIYNDNISLIIDGKSPVEKIAPKIEGQQAQRQLIAPNTFDSILRRDVESGGRYGASNKTLTRKLQMTAPIVGTITRPFAPSKEQFGIEISATQDERIVSSDDGVVMSAHLSANNSFIIQIIHHNNMISIYQNVSELLVERGDRVVAGEVIGYIRGESQKKCVNYELWVDGIAVDPERYIIF